MMIYDDYFLMTGDFSLVAIHYKMSIKTPETFSDEGAMCLFPYTIIDVNIILNVTKGQLCGLAC